MIDWFITWKNLGMRYGKSLNFSTSSCWLNIVECLTQFQVFFSKNRIRTSHHGPSVRLNPFGLFLRRAFYLKWRMQCKKILILFTELKLFQCWLRRFIQIGWYVRSLCPCMVPKDTQLFNPRIENLGDWFLMNLGDFWWTSVMIFQIAFAYCLRINYTNTY